MENDPSTKNDRLVIHAKSLHSVPNIQSIKYQGIQPYTTALIQAKLENSTQVETDNNYVMKPHSAFVDNNPNLNVTPHS